VRHERVSWRISHRGIRLPIAEIRALIELGVIVPMLDALDELVRGQAREGSRQFLRQLRKTINLPAPVLVGPLSEMTETGQRHRQPPYNCSRITVRAVRSEPAGRSATCVAKSCSNARSNPGGINRHVAAPGGLKRGRGEPKQPLAARFEPSATTVRDREVPGSNPGPRHRPPTKTRIQTRQVSRAQSERSAVLCCGEDSRLGHQQLTTTNVGAGWQS
jgi:hypothetical protein